MNNSTKRAECIGISALAITMACLLMTSRFVRPCYFTCYFFFSLWQALQKWPEMWWFVQMMYRVKMSRLIMNFLRGITQNFQKAERCAQSVALHRKSAQLEGFPHKFVMIVRISTLMSLYWEVPAVCFLRIHWASWSREVSWCEYTIMMGDFCPQRWKPKTRAGSGGVTGMVAFFELVHHIQTSDQTTAKHVKHISVNQQSFWYPSRLDKWVFIWLLISTVYGLKEDKGDDKDDDGHHQHHNNNKWYESEALWSPCRWYPRCFVIILLSPFCSIIVAQHLSRPVFWPVFCWPSFILARHRPMRLKWYEVFHSFHNYILYNPSKYIQIL